jgi:hypothetical protein
MTKKAVMKQFGGLEWLTIVGIPVTKTKFGEGIEAKLLKKIENTVSAFIVRKLVPIRGVEVEYLRKTFGYSLGRMGAELGFSPTAILKWERAKGKRLEKVNEVAVRAWAADKLKIEISGRLSKLVAATDEPQVPVKLKAA